MAHHGIVRVTNEGSQGIMCVFGKCVMANSRHHMSAIGMCDFPLRSDLRKAVNWDDFLESCMLDAGYRHPSPGAEYFAHCDKDDQHDRARQITLKLEQTFRGENLGCGIIAVGAFVLYETTKS